MTTSKGGTRVSYEVGVNSDDECNRSAHPTSAALAAQVDEHVSAILGRSHASVNWATLPAGDAAERWADLRAWVVWFCLEFGFDHRVVPPCWYRHRALVSLLVALRDHWTSAYDGSSALGPSDWHRTLIPMEGRLREWASRTGCNIREHRPDPVASVGDDKAEWEAHVQEDVARRRQVGPPAGGAARARGGTDG